MQGSFQQPLSTYCCISTDSASVLSEEDKSSINANATKFILISTTTLKIGDSGYFSRSNSNATVYFDETYVLKIKTITGLLRGK